jgi:ABC-type branched-subunit amino acid transport system permease subunit
MERAKEFVTEHKTALLLTGAAVAGLAGGYYYIKRYNNSSNE